jgi:hypothetical protein
VRHAIRHFSEHFSEKKDIIMAYCVDYTQSQLVKCKLVLDPQPWGLKGLKAAVPLALIPFLSQRSAASREAPLGTYERGLAGRAVIFAV